MIDQPFESKQQELAAAPPDGPAVPEGREPAAVHEEVSDEELKAAYWEAYRETAMCGADASWLAGLRAVAGLGRPAPAATEGEAMEQPEASAGEARALARAIDEVAQGWHPQACLLGNVTAKQFRRAAGLLRQYWLWLGRQQRLQQENHRFREPERTILCDILANGTLLPDPDGTRYGIPLAPAAGDVGEALAARPLLEQVAAIGDCISEQTVGRVRVLADRASAWLAENPPGQPVAIEPRGCPMPGACSCVKLPTTAAGEPPAELVEQWMREASDQPPGPDARVIAALAARWGATQIAERRPATTAAGEVGELVEWLERQAAKWEIIDREAGLTSSLVAGNFTRAAALLAQLAAAAPAVVPVPVSERLLGEGDCDAEGRCWWWRTDDADEWWELLCINDAREYNAGCGNARYTHWLPAHAIPLPAPKGGEGK